VSAIRIASRSIQQKGERGYVVTLPPLWVKDLGLKVRDKVDFLRDEQDRLIVVPAEKKTTGGER